MHSTHAESELEQERAFYDQAYSAADVDESIPEHLLPNKEKALWNRYVGSLEGKQVLEVGCGNGRTAVWLASQGAFVRAVDLSPVGVQKTMQRAQRHGLKDRVQAFSADVVKLAEVIDRDSVDMVFGVGVLHHFPPKEFGQNLQKVLRPGGCGIFFENSNANPVYRFARRFCNNESTCGSPLTAEEADTIIAAVGDGERIYPRFGLFGLAKKYFLRGNRGFESFVEGIDSMLDRIPGIRPWSAYMWVFVRKPTQ